jgi:hypothetical protein
LGNDFISFPLILRIWKLLFLSTYPNIAAWTRIASYGWIEIGQDDYSKSFIRVLDEGGMLWESKPNYKFFDDVLNDLEAALEKIIDEIGYNKRPQRRLPPVYLQGRDFQGRVSLQSLREDWEKQKSS